MSTSTIIFEVSGRPQAKERPRFGKNRIYTPKKTGIFEEHIAAAYRVKAGRLPPCAGPVSIRIKAEYQHPESWSRKKKESTLYKTSRPDIDNIEKACLDGLNGVAYKDDSQVAHIESTKKYGECDRIIVEIRHLP